MFMQAAWSQTQMWNGQAGGDGTWSENGTNWESTEGDVGTWQGGIAFFTGKSGVVTLQNTASFKFKTLNFLTDGYQLVDGVLSIDNPENNNNGIIEIGKDKQASIQSVIRNGGNINALLKTGSGLLTLGGENEYTGSTYILGGTLSVSDDKNLGDPLGGVMLENSRLLVTGSTFNESNREFHMISEKCTISIANAGNTLKLTKLFDGEGSLYKEGGGTLSLPLHGGYQSNITVLDGKLELASSVYSVVKTGPVEVRSGTVSFSVVEDKYLEPGELSGQGDVEKTGKGILMLSEMGKLQGTLYNREGIVELKKDWLGGYEQMTGARLVLSPDISVYGNAILRDTIVQEGTVTWRDDVELNKAVFKLGPNSEIVIRGDLSLTDMNTIVLDKEPEIPVSLMKVSGNLPTEAELASHLQVKVGKKLISDNPDYVFTIYENEIFLRDKNRPFPLAYKVNLEVSDDIDMYEMQPGQYTYIHGERIYFRFRPQDTGIPKESIIFEVNGVETAFRDMGDNAPYIYQSDPVSKDYSIRISIKEDPEDPTANMEPDSYPRITAQEGMILIETATPQAITVYSITGKMCAERNAGSTTIAIPLPKGIYIVRMGTGVHKVMVR